MTDVYILALMSGIFIATGAYVVWVLSRGVERGAEVYSGVIAGHQISTENRWTHLYTAYVPIVVANIALPVPVGFALLEMSRQVASENMSLVGEWYAYTCFVVAGLSALSMPLNLVIFSKRIKSDLRGIHHTGG